MPSELIEIAGKYGATSYIADPHEAANVSGEKGIDFILDQTENCEANVFIMMPSCVPSSENEDNGSMMTACDMRKYLNNQRVLGLGEVMNSD